MMFYFAYGSNLHGGRFKKRAPSAVTIGAGVLDGYVLRFHKRGMDGSGKCSVVETGRSEDGVYGAIYEITGEDKANLDREEPGYGEKAVRIVSGDRRIDATTYVAKPENVDDALVPYKFYLDLVIAGAREHGLPASYIERLQAVPWRKEP